MLIKFRQSIALLFDDADNEKNSSVKLGRLFLWLTIAGIFGGLSSFIWPTNHGLLVSTVSSALFIILTANHYQNGS